MFQINSPTVKSTLTGATSETFKQTRLKLFSRRITYITQKLQILIPAYEIKMCLRNKNVIQRFMLARKYRKV